MQRVESRKLFVVGDGGVGKSELIERMKMLCFNFFHWKMVEMLTEDFQPAFMEDGDEVIYVFDASENRVGERMRDLGVGSMHKLQVGNKIDKVDLSKKHNFVLTGSTINVSAKLGLNISALGMLVNANKFVNV